jgi:hypothetical protein
MPDALPPAAVRPTVQLLPLLALRPERFQSFCRDLVSALPEVVECHQYGVSGDPQGGIDLVSTDVTGETVCHQCRRVQKFGPADLRNLAETVTYQASRYYALVACAATAGVRDEEKKHELWTVWDVDDISAKVRALSTEVARRIVRTNFSGQFCRDFLGIEPFGAFLEPDDFFAPFLDSSRIFNHSYELVGRSEELEKLEAFVANPEHLIFVLPGRGGIGKSKLLQAFAQRAEQTHHVYFAQLDFDITAPALGELPVSNTILIIDDAHRRKDLGLLFQHAVRTRTKLVLATRPQLRDELPSLASRHHIDVREMASVEPLEQMTLSDVETLAAEVLGPDFRHLARELAAATRDCPLITIVGGRLLREHRVAPSLLANDELFRETALARFFDEIVENAKPGSEEAEVRRLLEIIAALAPIQPLSQRFIAAVQALTSMDAETAASWCERLHRHGVLARRHDGLRIVPDLLSDYILGVACTRPGVNGSTFVEKIVASVGTLDHALLRNLAAVDWRVGRKTGEELRVLGAVWDSVVATFKSAPNSERRQMLGALKEVGYFLPKKMLELAKLALEFPTTAEETGPYAALVRTSHGDVVAALREVIRYAAYDPSTFDAACDFLWRLANDERLPKPRKNNDDKDPVGVLRGIMAPGPRKPVWVHRRLMNRVETWLKIAQTPAEWTGIVRIVQSLFMKTGMDHTADDLTITTRSFLVPAEYLKGTRSRATAIVVKALDHSDREVVGTAVKALGEALQRPHSLGGLLVTEKQAAAWQPHRLEAMTILRRLAERNADAVIGIQIRETVEWYAERDTGDEYMREAAQQVLASLSETLIDRVARFINSPWGSHRMREVDQEEAARLLKATAKEFAATTQASDAIRQLDDVIGGLRILDLHPHPAPFLTAVANANPAVAAEMTELLTVTNAPELARYANSIVMAVRASDESRFHVLITTIVRNGAREMAAAVVASYAWWMGEDDLNERDLENITALFAMGGEVAVAGLSSLPRLAKRHPRTAAPLLLGTDLRGDQKDVERMAEMFDEPEQTLFSTLTADELRSCIAKLETVPQLDGVHLGDFVEECGRRDPLAMMDLLLRRIEREDRVSMLRFTALPMDPPEVTIDGALSTSEEYESLLGKIADAYANGIAYDAPRLFMLASGKMNATAVAFLKRKSAERTDSAVTFVASCVRGEACRRLVLEDSAFVAQLLADAAAVDSELRDAMHDTLLRCVVPRTTTDDLRRQILTTAIAARDALPMSAPARDFYESVAAEIQRVERTVDVTTEDEDFEDEEEW